MTSADHDETTGRKLQQLLARISYPIAVHMQIYGSHGACVRFSHNAGLPFGAASIIKLPLLICIGSLVSTGDLSWDSHVRLTVPAPHGTGLLEYLDIRDSMPLHDLCVLMMGVSDNMACNQLLEVVGMDRANALMRELGYNTTSFRRKMMDHETLAKGIDNTVTAEETADMLRRLHERTLVSRETSERVLEFLGMNQFHDLVAWPLPGSITLWGKTGGMPGSLLDAELIRTTNGIAYSLCVFATGFERAVQAKRLIAEVSEVVYTSVTVAQKSDA